MKILYMLPVLLLGVTPLQAVEPIQVPGQVVATASGDTIVAAVVPSSSTCTTMTTLC